MMEKMLQIDKTIYMDLMPRKVPNLTYSAINSFYKECVELFDCPWIKYNFPEPEVQQMINRCLQYYNSSVGADKRIISWRTFMDLVGQTCKRSDVINYSALTGLGLLNNFAFDIEDDILSISAYEALDIVNTLVKENFPEEFQSQVYTSWATYVYNFILGKQYNIKEKIFRKAPELYIHLRCYDGGVHPYMICLAAAYKDPQLLYIMSQTYTLHMVTICLIYINDVFSFNKEIEVNELANHLIIKQSKTNIHPDLLLEETLKDLSTCVSHLKLLFPDKWEVLSWAFRGNLEWSFSTHRYGVASYNTELRD